MKRGFTQQELHVAREMMGKGATFSAIARALGRRSHDGIRRRFDPKYRARRNAYQAEYMRGRR